jgi:hypothetical protein
MAGQGPAGLPQASLPAVAVDVEVVRAPGVVCAGAWFYNTAMVEQLDSVTTPAPARAAGGGRPSAHAEGPRAKPPGADDYGEQDENGVDLSLLRYMLRLSPLERLRVMERHARDTQLLNEYGRRAREAPSPPHR